MDTDNFLLRFTSSITSNEHMDKVILLNLLNLIKSFQVNSNVIVVMG